MSWGLLIVVLGLFAFLVLIESILYRLGHYKHLDRKRVSLYSLGGNLLQMLVLVLLICATTVLTYGILYEVNVVARLAVEHYLGYALVTVLTVVTATFWCTLASKVIDENKEEQRQHDALAAEAAKLAESTEP